MQTPAGFDLQRFAQERNIVVTALSKDPRRFAATMYQEKASGLLGFGDKETFSPYLTTNEDSLCCLIGKAGENLEQLPKICSVAVVDPLGSGKQGQIYKITVADQKFVIKTREVNSLFLSYSEEPPTAVKELQSRKEEIALCLYRDLTSTKYLGLDEFTNEVIIGFLLDAVYQNYAKASGLKGYIKHYSATICNQKRKKFGVNFLEFADRGDLFKFVRDPSNAAYLEGRDFQESGTGAQVKTFRLYVFTRSALIDLLKQIVANLHFLQETIQFTHGDLKMLNILVRSEDTSINYNGMTHTSDLSFKIADFGRSSMTLKLGDSGTRIYNRLAIAETYLGVVGFKPSVGTFFNQPYYEVDYNITASLIARLRHMGVPFYRSWDTYTFLLSLLTMPEVFYVVFTDPTIQAAIWDPMWFPEDSSRMFLKLQKAVTDRKEPSFSNTVDMLKGSRLKCQGTGILFEHVKNL